MVSLAYQGDIVWDACVSTIGSHCNAAKSGYSERTPLVCHGYLLNASQWVDAPKTCRQLTYPLHLKCHKHNVEVKATLSVTFS